MKMKLSNLLKDDEELISELESNGVELNDNAALMIIPTPENRYIKCRQNDENVHLEIEDIIFIESFAHDVIVHSKRGDHTTSLRIKQFADILPRESFIQISQSAIVAVAHITKIRAALNTKYYITVSSGEELTVTRSYYYEFKSFFGI